MIYDSKEDTLQHIDKVRTLLGDVRANLWGRAAMHDHSKLEEPEKSVYDEFTHLLAGLTYGSEEYRATIAKMGDAVRHHYEVNDHHPEHYPNGINGMSLPAVVEMLSDWKAASERVADGDIWKSLEINKERFGISDQLYEILKNTLREFGW